MILNGYVVIVVIDFVVVLLMKFIGSFVVDFGFARFRFFVVFLNLFNIVNCIVVYGIYSSSVGIVFVYIVCFFFLCSIVCVVFVSF